MKPLVVCGIPRSGSTLVGQIFREVFPDREVLKTHPHSWEPDGELFVATIRNPHDVVASMYRVRLSRGGEGVEGPEGLEVELDRVRGNFKYMSRFLTTPHLLLRYEDFYNNHLVIYNGIEKSFNRRVSPSERTRIDDKFSLKANRERASRLKDFNQVDNDGIHGDHIGPVLPGTWRESLPRWALSRVVEVCYSMAREHGYG